MKVSSKNIFSWKFAIFTIYIALIQLHVLKANPNNAECSSCTSNDCISHANRVIRNLKPNVEPCEDFFSFACGDYLAKFGSEDTRSIYDDTWNSLEIIIKDLLENLQPRDGTASAKLKMVYDSCIRKDSSEMRSVADALDFLNQVGIFNWPHVDPNFQFADLGETLGKLAVYGEFAFINFQPSPYEDSGARSNGLPTVMVLPGTYLLASKMKPQDVHDTVFRIWSYFNALHSQSEFEQIWENFKAIEEIGKRLQNDEAENGIGCKGILRNSYTVINCSQEMRDSMKFLCNLWKSAVKSGILKQYYSMDTIHISCHWNHFYYIENIFSNLSTVNDRATADYLSLRFFINHLDDMNLYFHLTKKTYPEDKGSPTKTPEPIRRWEYCIGWIIKHMSLALGYEYTKSVLTSPIEKNALDMIEDYVQTLSGKIGHESWIEHKVKLYLKKQLEKLEIGLKSTMKTFRNQTTVSDYYKEFHPVEESFLKNILEYGVMSLIKKDDMPFNSFYSSSDPYTMDFGLALFLPPTYSHGLPKIWNYAGLGSIIGHELSHNLKFYFDLVPLDDVTESTFNSKIQCYVNQYSQYIMEKTGKAISSNEAKEEIIADNIGWELTEKVLEHVLNTSDHLILPGLEYTPLQLMFISFTQDSCTALSKEVENEFYSSKPHNLQNLRVLSILQNSKMFSEAFNCSTMKPMNPENKCVFFDDLN